jgi:predicted lipoprotein with Yx(FWY)xxD motif
VTYNGWPLYTWAEDNAPGQATGEGLDNLGGLWWVLNPSGDAIEKTGAGST